MTHLNNRTENKTADEQVGEWKTKTYIGGTLVGALLGGLSAYLYARAAEEEEITSGEKPQIKTTQLLSLALAVLGLIRQFTEAGKSKKK